MTSDKKKRRRYSESNKAQVLAECSDPGASVARVAMAHGINAHVVHRWRQLCQGQAPYRTRQEKRVHRAPASCADGARRGGASYPSRTQAWAGLDYGHLAGQRGGRACRLDSRVVAVIRVDAVRLAVEPLDMRAGTEAALRRVVVTCPVSSDQ